MWFNLLLGLLFIGSIRTVVDFLFKEYFETVSRRFGKAESAKIVGFDSKKDPYSWKFEDGRDPNEYYSVVEYYVQGVLKKGKIRRSREDYIGRKVAIYSMELEMGYRASFEFPYLDIPNWISICFPIVFLVMMIVMWE